MDCEPNLHPLGGLGTGVNPFGSDYPFLKPSGQERYILTDAFLSFTDTEAKPPFAIDWMFGFDWPFCLNAGSSSSSASISGSSSASSASSASSVSDGYPTPTHVTDLRIVDANGRVVFDSTQASYYRGVEFGPRLYIHEWRNDECVCRVVQHTARNAEEDWFVPPQEIFPESGQLDAFVCQLIPGRVTKLHKHGEASSPGIVELYSGYNVSFRVLAPDTTSTSLRKVTRIEVNAGPGDGLGRYPGCDEDTPAYIYTLNQTSPNEHGDFLLSGNGCIYVRQQVEVVNEEPRVLVATPNALKIGSNCSPCCECEDYVNFYKAFLKVHAKWKELGERASAVRDALGRIIDRWEEERGCRESKSVRLAGYSAYPEFLELSLSMCNTSDNCYQDVHLELDIEIQEGETLESMTPDQRQTTSWHTLYGKRKAAALLGVFPNYRTAAFNILPPGHALQVRTRLFAQTATASSMSGTSLSETSLSSSSGQIVFETRRLRLTLRGYAGETLIGTMSESFLLSRPDE